MKLHSFSELCKIGFHLDYLTISGTIEKPYRTFRCVNNQVRFDRFYYIEKGEYSITQEGHETLCLHPGDILYLPNNCAYSAEWLSEEIGYRTVIFLLNDGEQFSLSDSICLVLKDRNGIAFELIQRLLGIPLKGEIGSRIKSKALFYELLHFITLETVRSEISNSYADISAAILYFENNYTTDITVSELAKMCSMCESRFRRKFSEYAGMPPVRYRNYLRVKKAAELLSGGEYTVSEAAELVGIPDISYFCRLFREQMGMKPSDMKLSQ